MIGNPKYGWCKFKLGDFEGHPSYLTDVPLDLLNAFINYHTKGCGMCWFDEEGTEFTFVITPYSLYIIEEKDMPILHDFSDLDVFNLEKELIHDIENDLSGWANFVMSEDLNEIEEFEDIIKTELNILKDILLRQGVKL